MDVPVRPGDALSQPTRARVFELLGGLQRPAATEELASGLGLHPNGVRLHLERLLEAGLVERRRERQARGRPRDTWVISPDAQPSGDPPTGYAALSRWLVRALVDGGTKAGDMEETGRLIGRALRTELPGSGERRHSGDGSPDPGSDEHGLFDALSSLGFQPERQRVDADRVAYTLRNCPYRQAVHERQSLVCALHRGLTAGLVEAIDPESSLEAFEAKDPDRAGCLVRVRGGDAGRDQPGRATPVEAG